MSISGSLLVQTKVGQGGGVWTPCLFPCYRRETCSVLRLTCAFCQQLGFNGTKRHPLHYLQPIDLSSHTGCAPIAHFLLPKSQLMRVISCKFMPQNASPPPGRGRSIAQQTQQIRPSANQKGTALPIEQEEKHRLASCQISNESVADI